MKKILSCAILFLPMLYLPHASAGQEDFLNGICKPTECTPWLTL